MKGIYISSISQISLQKPLCDEWMDNPINLEGRVNFSVDPDYSQFLKPMEARRMGNILKRAIATSVSCLRGGNMGEVDAVITGTGLGCLQDTEAFLNAVCKIGDAVIRPTNFMQSTHNTISSLIAIHLKCHGYNATYSHNGISFESALADAFTQFKLGNIESALVGAFDEMSPTWFKILEGGGYAGRGEMASTSEVAASILLKSDNDGALCRLGGIKMVYRGDNDMLQDSLNSLLKENGITVSDIDMVLTGKNGDIQQDNEYDKYCNLLFESTPRGGYKHLFGECNSSSAMGFYAAAACFKYNRIPHTLCPGLEDKGVKNILIINHFNNKNTTLTLLCGE